MQKRSFKAFEALFYHFSTEIVTICMYVGYTLIQPKQSKHFFNVVNLIRCGIPFLHVQV